jgi:Mlc titration factor MtfA (ptsG expression regulator)
MPGRFARRRRARALRRGPFPEEWRALLERNVVHWHVLAPDDRARLEAIVVHLVVDKRWEAAHGFALTDEIQVVIAAQAALLVLELGTEAYRGVGTIIVHPTTMHLQGERQGPIPGTRTDSPVPVLGVAHYEGPVIIAWDSARRAARHPERGHNVVYHEFAHKIDMLDGIVDGTPPLERREQLERWVAVCTEEYQALRAGTDDGFLSTYAGVNPAEFFAVATEMFFDVPIAMRASKPALYGVLRDFYRQDPAAVAERVSDRDVTADRTARTTPDPDTRGRP